MANTIQIKRSDGNSAPGSLGKGELAWVDHGTGGAAGKLYIGDMTSAGAVVRTIAGPGHYAPLADAALTGNPTAPTQSSGNNSTRIATTAYVDAAAGATTLDGLTDTALSGVGAAHVLIYDGSNSWDNKAVSGDITINASGVTAIGNDKVTNAMMADDAIDTPQIADDAITAALIDDQAITNAAINNSAAIAVSKLAASTISGVTLGSNLATLTIGTGMAATTYTGASAATVAVDGVLEDLDTLGAASGDGEFIVATGAGAFAYESGNTARTSLGLGTGNTPTFNGAAMGSAKITGVADPTSAQDAATKAYVDATKTGLDVKGSVRVATTANITIASDLNNNDTLDGITLATNDRVLVKNQSTASQNGIYVVGASPARASDFDADAEVTPGAFTFVEEGTANADSGWVLTTDGSITVGTTGLAFTQFSGAGQLTAGAGMTKSGNTLNVIGTADKITVSADAVTIATTYIGQNSITTLGTITTGTWNATAISATKGGTAIDTSSSTGVPSISSGTWSVAARLTAALGGTAIDTSSSTGVPSISSGTWSVGATLGVALGGTAIASYTAGDLLYASGGTTLTKLAKGTTGMVLQQGGSNAPVWGVIDGGTF